MSLRMFQDLLAKRPFVPFNMTMSSGKHFEVRHPENAFLSKTAIYVAVDIDDGGAPAEIRICSFLHVTSIEPIDQPQPAAVS